MWSHDGKRVAFYGNDRDGASYDIYVVDAAGTRRRELIVGGQQDTWYPLDWSFDDRKLLLWKFVSVNESYLYIADITTGTLTPVDDRQVPGTGSAASSPPTAAASMSSPTRTASSRS